MAGGGGALGRAKPGVPPCPAPGHKEKGARKVLEEEAGGLA